MVSVTIELDKKDKESMEQICGEMGLPLNAAFAVFTKKVVRERRIPFEINAGINIDKEILSTPFLSTQWRVVGQILT